MTINEVCTMSTTFFFFSSIINSTCIQCSILPLQSLPCGMSQCDELFNLTSADENTVDFCHPVNYPQLFTVSKIGHCSFIIRVCGLSGFVKWMREMEETLWTFIVASSLAHLDSSIFFLILMQSFRHSRCFCVASICECMVRMGKISYSYLNWNLTTMSFAIQFQHLWLWWHIKCRVRILLFHPSSFLQPVQARSEKK